MVTEQRTNLKRTKNLTQLNQFYWMLGVTFLFAVYYSLSRQFIYERPLTLWMVLISAIILPAFLVSALWSLVKFIQAIIAFFRGQQSSWAPFVLLVIQVLVVVNGVYYSVPDFYRIHEKELNGLVTLVNEQLNQGHISENGVNIEVPKELKGLPNIRWMPHSAIIF
ncbi:MAG TPA: hypothetical protein VHY08_14460 [Bacillota bacterium]|nr:hypothetical protein [Bacillota bacterium]